MDMSGLGVAMVNAAILIFLLGIGCGYCVPKSCDAIPYTIEVVSNDQ